jgi:predicted CXXCH cytochrome family protein
MVLFHIFCALVLAGALPARAEAPLRDTCVSCHADLDDEELVAPVRLMEQDIHSRQGLSCADCHGGNAQSNDEDEAMDEAGGYLGVPGKQDLLQVCGQCHSNAQYMRQYNPALRIDQVALYRTSVHGQRLLEKGDKKVAGCVDCHGAHGILPASDPRSPVHATKVPQTCGHCHSDPMYMKEYGLPTDQYEKYRKSVHGRPLLERGDLGAPACNDCHGNHGATPPGVKSLANVCGQCHPLNNELVAQSPHQPAFEKLGIAACETCHNHHDIEAPGDEMVGPEPPAVCARCHRQDKSPEGREAAQVMRAALDSLVEQHRAAEALVRRAERAGMEVGEALFELNETAGRLTRMRSVLHSFDSEKVLEVQRQGMEIANKAYQQGQAALEELQFRRKGLGLSLVVIALLAAGLYVKIRRLDREYPPFKEEVKQ